MTTHSRKALTETWIILLTWCVFCAWVLLVCCDAYLTIDRRLPAPELQEAELTSAALVPTVCGLPSWVFWGIAVPWASASVLTIVFALRGIREDDLPHDALANGELPRGDLLPNGNTGREAGDD